MPLGTFRIKHIDNREIAARVLSSQDVIGSPQLPSICNARCIVPPGRRTWPARGSSSAHSRSEPQTGYTADSSPASAGCWLPTHPTARSQSCRPIAVLAMLSKVRTVCPRNSCITRTSSRQVPSGSKSRWNVSPASDRVTAPFELISQRSNPSLLRDGQRKSVSPSGDQNDLDALGMRRRNVARSVAKSEIPG